MKDDGVSDFLLSCMLAVIIAVFVVVVLYVIGLYCHSSILEGFICKIGIY